MTAVSLGYALEEEDFTDPMDQNMTCNLETLTLSSYVAGNSPTTGIVKDSPWLNSGMELPTGDLDLFSQTSTDFDSNANLVPEPSAFALLGVGAVGLLGVWRRRRLPA